MKISPLHLQYLISLSFTAVTTFLLAIFVYLRNAKRLLNKLFAFYSVSITCWCLGQIFLTIAANHSKIEALLWGRLLHIGVVFIPAAFVHFVFVILDLKPNKRLLRIAYILSFAFLLSIPSKYFIPDAIPKLSYRFFITAGVLYYFLIIFFVSMVTYGLYRLYKGYKQATGIKQNQLKYLFWSSLFGYLGGSPNLLLVLGFELYPLNPFGTYLVGLYIVIIGYAILKFNLMDIKIASTRAGLFTIVYTLVLGIPLGLTGWGRSWLEELFGAGWCWAPVILAIILASAGPFAYNYFRYRAEARLLAKKHLRHQKLREFSTYMMRFNKLKTLVSLIVHYVVKILGIRHAALYLLAIDKYKTQQYTLAASYGIPHKENLPLSVALDSGLVKELSKGLAIDKEQLKQKIDQNINYENLATIQQEMSILKADIIIPAFLRLKPLGFLVLGESRANETFDQEDINVLQLLSNEAALALENALFWQKEEEKIIETQKEQIASDISIGAGHQFNNRLNAIGMATDTVLLELLDRDINQIPFEELKEILHKILDRLKKVSEECQFGGQITAGIMSLAGSEPQNFTDFNLLPIIVSSIELVQMKHSSDRAGENRPTVTINKNLPQNLPLILGSDAQIRDCLFNVIDNAYDAAYTKEEKITKKDPYFEWPENQPYAPKIDITAFVKDDRLVITIADNGLGMKDTDKRKIFAGYFTTKATGIKGHGPGGHGVGLYTVKRLIQAHKGKIHFTSEYGKGTTFSIELPVSKRNNISSHA